MRALSCFGCCTPTVPPDYPDAAAYLNAQCEALLTDELCPALQVYSPAQLVYGTKMFRTATAHGMSPAAECSLVTLEGKTIAIRLDASGISVLPAANELWSDASKERFCEVVDLLAEHSPAFVYAFREVNGAVPTVQRRKPTNSRPRSRYRVQPGSLEDASNQWATLISRSRGRTNPAVRLHDSNVGLSPALEAEEPFSGERTPTAKRNRRTADGPQTPTRAVSSESDDQVISDVEPTLAPVLIERMPSDPFQPGPSQPKGPPTPHGPTRLVLNAATTMTAAAASSIGTSALHATTVGAKATYNVTSAATHAATHAATAAVGAASAAAHGATHHNNHANEGIEQRALLGRKNVGGNGEDENGEGSPGSQNGEVYHDALEMTPQKRTTRVSKEGGEVELDRTPTANASRSSSFDRNVHNGGRTANDALNGHVKPQMNGDDARSSRSSSFQSAKSGGGSRCQSNAASRSSSFARRNGGAGSPADYTNGNNGMHSLPSPQQLPAPSSPSRYVSAPSATPVDEREELKRRAAQAAEAAPFPPVAYLFCGNWRLLTSEGYSEFLADVIGLPWAVRKIGERIYPTPIISMSGDGKTLCCETVCFGGKPVYEVLMRGHSTFHEPNQNVDYDVQGEWQGETFVASRRSPRIRNGQPIVKRIFLNSGGNELTIAQSWGGECDFVATFCRRR